MKIFLILMVTIHLMVITIFAQFPRDQKIIAGEYFINNDPGVGNAVPINANYGFGEIEVNVPNIILPTGATIYVRFKSTNGKWSAPRSIKRKEYFENKNALLQYGEYYINSDPGRGNGNPINVSLGTALIQNLKLKRGDRIYVRVKDSFNRWSIGRPVQFNYKDMLSAEYKIKRYSGGTTTPEFMSVSSPNDSSCVFIATKENISWNIRDTVFVRFTSVDRFISNWIQGPLQSVGIFDETDIPNKYYLLQNYPNPFNPSTTIEYFLPVESKVKLVIVNVLGEVVKVLVNSVELPGNKKVNFDGGNLSSGVYFYLLEAYENHGNYLFREIKKLVLIK